MNPPEQKCAATPEQSQQENNTTTYLNHYLPPNLTVDWEHNPIPHCKSKFAEKKELLSTNFDTIKKITKLRNENTKIEELIKKYLIELDRETDKINKEREEFAKEKEYQEREYEKCNLRLNTRATAIEAAVRDCSEDKMVSLNIGGEVFLTLKSTISNISPFFANLFSDNWKDAQCKTIRDKDGNIFIDRSPLYFQYILDWSRNGADPQELIDIIQALSCPTWTDQTGLNSKLSMKTFMKTLEYYGIDNALHNMDPEIFVGNRLDIYWRGDKRTYKGTVKELYFDEDLQELFIIINYEDSTTWKYKVTKLAKTTGPYSRKEMHNAVANKTKWWHYGEDKGGIIIKSASKQNLNPSPSSPSTTEI